MRFPLRLASLLLAGAILAGCTSDGYLGEVDEGRVAEQRDVREATLWERAAASHPVDVSARGETLEIEGGLAPVRVASLTLQAVQPRPDPIFGARTTASFALAGATLDGERGWLVVNATRAPSLAAQTGVIEIGGHTLRAEGAALQARLATSPPMWRPMPPFGCFESATPDEPVECADWRASLPPPKPDALANFSEAAFDGVTLPDVTVVRGDDVLFHAGSGPARPLTEAVVGTEHATLVALASPFGGMLDPVQVDVPLAREDVVPEWSGNLTLHATLPSGTLALGGGERMLDGHDDALLKLRDGGVFSLTSGATWTFATEDAELVDLRVDDQARLESTLRLAPNVMNATGPAGNTTRVKLILAETSLGADAHVTGYRIDESVRARYLGWEPFAVTNELLRIMNETEGPIAAGVLLTLGIALPWVAFGEAFVAALTTIFPPSLAGSIGPGEARLLTFEIEMPSQPRDVEILIEAENAEPVRATLRLIPTA